MDIHVKKCGGKKQTNMRISVAYLGCGGYQGFFVDVMDMHCSPRGVVWILVILNEKTHW